LTEEELQKYVGSYKRQVDDDIRPIIMKDGQLLYTFPSGDFRHLIPMDEHEFAGLETRFIVKFDIENGEATSMTIRVDNSEREIVAVRVDQN